MNGSAKREANGKALRRLVALLLALAGLADHASRRSGPVLHFVLWLLRSAEAVAWDHVRAIAGKAACAPAPSMHPIAGRDEALRLAASFRALAMALAGFADQLMAGRASGMARTLEEILAAIAGLAASPAAVERRDSS